MMQRLPDRMWRWSGFSYIVVALTLLVGLGLGVVALLHSPASGAPDQPQQRQATTTIPQDGIQSRLVTRHSTRERSSILYPVTPDNHINQTIAQVIDGHDAQFRAALGDHDRHQPATQTIGYQVFRNDGRVLSIALYVTQHLGDIQPRYQTHAWTFARASSQPLRTGQLFTTPTAMARVARAVNQAAASLPGAPTGAPPTQITPDRLEQFIVVDDTTIGFVLPTRWLGQSRGGTRLVKIPLDQVAHHLDRPTANRLLGTPGQAGWPTPTASRSRSPLCQHTPCVALTFDDGPGVHTPRLLDRLDGAGAKATFYVLGQAAARHPDLLRRQAAAGHQIGNHTWGHPDLTRLGPVQVRDEVQRTNDTLADILGVAPRTIRPPYGAINDAVRHQLRDLGMVPIMWSVDTWDWADRDSAIVCNRAVSRAQPGAIILLHDIHATSVDAVGCIIEGLQTQGYRLVTVDQLLGTGLTPGQTYSSGP